MVTLSAALTATKLLRNFFSSIKSRNKSFHSCSRKQWLLGTVNAEAVEALRDEKGIYVDTFNPSCLCVGPSVPSSKAHGRDSSHVIPADSLTLTFTLSSRARSQCVFEEMC